MVRVLRSYYLDNFFLKLKTFRSKERATKGLTASKVFDATLPTTFAPVLISFVGNSISFTVRNYIRKPGKIKVLWD